MDINGIDIENFRLFSNQRFDLYITLIQGERHYEVNNHGAHRHPFRSEFKNIHSKSMMNINIQMRSNSPVFD